MERTCERAIEIGLPALVFTEHVDYTAWTVPAADLQRRPHYQQHADPAGLMSPPRLDVRGYQECIQRCRDRFPSLRIVTGVEVGEPHLHSGPVGELLASGAFDRVLGSLHTLPTDDGVLAEASVLYRTRDATRVIRDYLAGITELIKGSDAFTVLAHIDYPVRSWPESAGPFDATLFEDEYRHALRVLADSGRALEINTRGQTHPRIVRWWHEEGGDAVSFGSDAHYPDALARNFAEAAAMAESCGFRAGRDPYDLWARQS
jgi:histidinol-phosphatase (PHP family)